MGIQTAPPPSGATKAYAAPMTWQDIVEHPALQDLPFKIEQDAWGRVVMSPASFQHARQQGRFIHLLAEHLGDEVVPEVPIATAEGTKVPDVVWLSDEFVAQHKSKDVLPIAPPLCVEVRSPSNTDAEMEEKVMLYLAKGAQEVWLCDLEGNVTFFSHEGAIDRSRLAPDFPSRLDV